MERRENSVIIRRRCQEKKEQSSREMAQISELRQRFGITRVELVAKALRIPENEILELLKNGI